MTDKVEPQWTWDEEAEAGYLDFDPDYSGIRYARVLDKKGGVTVLVDYNPKREIIGLEILV